MLHTVVSLGEVFPQAKAAFCERQDGASWLCVREYNNQKSIERLISTNPFDYLNPALLPGTQFDENAFNSYKSKQGVDNSDGEHRRFNKIQRRTDGRQNAVRSEKHIQKETE